LGDDRNFDLEDQLLLSMMELESPYNIACYHAISGNTDAALKALEQALSSRRSPTDWVRNDPDLDSIRNTQGYHLLKSKYRL
jgi:hypothetical protein